MRKKIRFGVFIVLLAAAIAVCRKAGDGLVEWIDSDRAVSAAVQRNENLVVVVPGHGGLDPGKVGVNGAEEKDINLKIALNIKSYLEKENVEVFMTRTSDERLSDTQVGDLKERVRLMNEKNPVLAVSIHQNSYQDESVRGAQVFYYTDSRDGEEAAGYIQKALSALDPESAKERKANNTYYLLKKTEVPVVIAECGFLSNYEEAEKLSEEAYQEEVAAAVSDGILEYIDSVVKDK